MFCALIDNEKLLSPANGTLSSTEIVKQEGIVWAVKRSVSLGMKLCLLMFIAMVTTYLKMHVMESQETFWRGAAGML